MAIREVLIFCGGKVVVESERRTGEHSPSRSTTSGTLAHATGPSSGPRYPSKSSSLSETHDSPSIYSKRTAGSEGYFSS